MGSLSEVVLVGMLVHVSSDKLMRVADDTLVALTFKSLQFS